MIARHIYVRHASRGLQWPPDAHMSVSDTDGSGESSQNRQHLPVGRLQIRAAVCYQVGHEYRPRPLLVLLLLRIP